MPSISTVLFVFAGVTLISGVAGWVAGVIICWFTDREMEREAAESLQSKEQIPE